MTSMAQEIHLEENLHRLFLHFFDIHFLEARAVTPQNKAAIKEARLATRLALLIGDEVLIPAASYIESTFCYSIIEELRPIFDFGIIRLVGGGESAAEFCEEKLIQYPKGSHQFECYEGMALESLPPFRSRFRSSTRDISSRWLERLDDVGFPGTVFGERVTGLPKNLELRWENVPDELGKRAFIVGHVIPRIFNRGTVRRNLAIRNRLHAVINQAYFQSYTEELGAGVLRDLVYLDAQPPIPSFGADVSYRNFLSLAREADLLREIEGTNGFGLLALRQKPLWVELRERLMYMPSHHAIVRDQIRTPGFSASSARQLRLFPRITDKEDRRIIVSEPIEHPRTEMHGQTIRERLTEGDRRRMRQTLDGLQKEWEARNAKITRLREGIAIEYGVAAKFQLEQQLDAEENDLAELAARMREIELLLES